MQQLLELSGQDFQRLLPYLPFGLMLPAHADPIARVQGEFKRMVLAQRLHPGQKVPLDTLASNVGVSRTPVREALRLLETEGLVAALPNRGFIVRAIDANEARQLYEARVCIEGQVVPRALERSDDAFVRDVVRLNETYRRSLGDSPSRRRLGMLADKAFHLRIAGQAGNGLLVAMLANVFDRLMFTRPLEGFPAERMRDAMREHQAIVAGLREWKSAGKGTSRVVAALTANIHNGGDAVVQYMREREALSVAI
ncbi:MAG TPA: GntR family transcriptional regulator [Casimicrobiaceae bacterium]|jgi:DNA-binding GntR family transcriptional regulator|nr:GntR family transcriptional regulator [Casimicrobiaceae bacterium]